MSQYKQKLKKQIIKQYGSVNEWTKQNSVSPERFYNFLKGSYNPTISTLEKWVASVDMELNLKSK